MSLLHSLPLGIHPGPSGGLQRLQDRPDDLFTLMSFVMVFWPLFTNLLFRPLIKVEPVQPIEIDMHESNTNRKSLR